MAISLDAPNGVSSRTKKIIGGIAVSAVALATIVYLSARGSSAPDLSDVCVQSPSIVPKLGKLDSSDKFLHDTYVEKSVEYLAGAIKIPTVTYDDMNLNVTLDDRFLTFNKFHKFLEKTFPLCNEYRETVNHYGLLYTIPGSNKHLKPIVLMAHQDVVPVNEETLDQWTHGAFSGHYDGTYIYGRGASDTKNTLIAILEAGEDLLKQKWKPERTVIFSFGFDEEIEGVRGAHELAETIIDRYGEYGVEAIIDEGFGLDEFFGTTFATPSIAEKGRLDLTFELLTPGGHSSMPPDHTGIGIMSELITMIEANPWSAHIEPDGVIAERFGCIGRWAKDLSDKERTIYTQLDKKDNEKVVLEQLNAQKFTRFMALTSQAVDTIYGGVKVNALPEKTVMQMNFRIAVHQTIQEVKDKILGHLEILQSKYDIGVEIDGKKVYKGNNGSFKITSAPSALKPAPISPTDGKAWEILSGTYRHIFEDVTTFSNDTLIIAPSVLTANSDTAHYWKVTENILRASPIYNSDMIDFHTVNERLGFKSHITSVMFFYEYMVNWSQ